MDNSHGSLEGRGTTKTGTTQLSPVRFTGYLGTTTPADWQSDIFYSLQTVAAECPALPMQKSAAEKTTGRQEKIQRCFQQKRQSMHG